jgi:hypothetical protein
VFEMGMQKCSVFGAQCTKYISKVKYQWNSGLSKNVTFVNVD